ncbi:MAG: sodium-dependent transporter [Kordiimonadaceae bacterium]|nr:sodium-dependent transporter [Kordiimonadaceae bacterium]
MEKKSYPSFSSRLGFIMVTAGAAVGLGNIWSFTYVVGSNGGGGFVLIYLLVLLFLATPIFMAELLLGRMGKASPPEALSKLQKQAGSKIPWAVPAWMGLISTIFILSFYAVIAGKVMGYGFEALFGGFGGWNGEQIADLNTSYNGNELLSAFWAGLFLALSVWIVGTGVRSGLERASKIMMPALFAMLLGLAIFAAIEGDFARGFDFLFGFRNVEFSAAIFLEALGLAFFTLSIGVGGIMVYGSYMGDDVSLPSATVWIVIMDLLVAILAGLAIFPLLFGAGLDAGVGPNLVFAAVPQAFAALPGGSVLAFIFFLLLTVAALTSAISLFTPTVQRLVENGWSRRKAAWSMFVPAFGLSILTTLSFGSWNDFYPLAFLGLDGLTFFDLIYKGTNNIVLPLGGLAFALIIGWGLQRDKVRAALSMKSDALFTIWYGLLKYIIPLAIIFLFVKTIWP